MEHDIRSSSWSATGLYCHAHNTPLPKVMFPISASLAMIRLVDCETADAAQDRLIGAVEDAGLAHGTVKHDTWLGIPHLVVGTEPYPINRRWLALDRQD